MDLFSHDSPLRRVGQRMEDSAVLRLLNSVHHAPKRMGQLLMLSVGTVVCCTAPFVGSGFHAHLMLLLVSLAMLLVLAATVSLPSSPRRASVYLVFPAP